MGIIADKIRRAIYGVDVREDIAQGIEAVESLREEFDIQVISAGNSNSEIVAARGGEVSLPVKINKIDSSLSEKAKTVDVNNALALRDVQISSLASGGPKNTFATLDLLQGDTSANTVDGKKYTYVVIADGKWYYWNGTAWTSGGTYQSTGIADKSITGEKWGTFYNSIGKVTRETGKRLTGYDDSGNIVLTTSATYFVDYFVLPASGELKIFKSTSMPSGQVLVLVDSNKIGFKTIGYNAPLGVQTKADWCVLYENYTEIDINKARLKYPNLHAVYLQTLTVDINLAYIHEIRTTQLSSYEWLDTSNILTKEENNRKIILPLNVPCLVNRQFNVHLDNALMYGDYYSAENYLVANAGTVEGAYQYTPAVDSVDKAITLNYYDGSLIKNTASTTLKPVQTNAGSGASKKILIIGESTTDNGYLVPELINLFSTDVMAVEFLGSRGTSPSRHEGRGGWTTFNYIKDAIYGSQNVVNAFYNPSKSTFDFSYYMAQQGYLSVDYVCIDLGINDVYQGKTMAETIANYNAMISSIRAFNGNIKIFIGLTNLPSKHKNINSFKLKNGILGLIDSLIKEYGNREAEGFYLIPIYLNIDPLWDMQYTTQAISNRNTKTTYVGSDSVHPGSMGYYKSADVHYNAFKYVASLESI